MVDNVHKGYEEKIHSQTTQIVEEQVKRIKENLDTKNSGMHS